LNNSVGVNSFVKRQTKTSGKTYCKTLSFKEIALHAEQQLKKGLFKNGYREGVVLVPVEEKLINDFVCPIVKITSKTKLVAEQVKRRDDEEAYIQIRATNGTPLKSNNVDLILYAHEVLKETNENETNNDWELISFHAIPKNMKDLPMGPVTMMRNQLQLPGGTKGFYSSEQWAKSVEFWQNYCFLK
tara:strand:+ start:100 stop:660 length:561 start_codon:yes stop_codon:yes gene_type:complete